YCGAVPYFVDCDATTLGVNAQKFAEFLRSQFDVTPDGARCKKNGKLARALVVMHTFGYPSDFDPLAKICRDYGMVLVEDAAESLGSYYKGVHTGTIGKISTLSFNGNKTVTTGGGGAILTNDAAMAARAKHITTTARVPHPWRFEHDEIGY